MERVTIKGNTALAKKLGVSRDTVQVWRRNGILDNAILADFRKTIIYDLEKVYDCLHHRRVKSGRRAAV